jgi:hypothetical protein
MYHLLKQLYLQAFAYVVRQTWARTATTFIIPRNLFKINVANASFRHLQQLKVDVLF